LTKLASESGPSPKSPGRRTNGAKSEPGVDFFVDTIGSEVCWEDRDVVFRQGDPADAIFYIKGGKIQLRITSSQGKEAIIALYGPGDFFGEACLAGQSVWLASAVALTDSKIVRIEKAAMAKLLHDKPDFAEKFLALSLLRNVQIEADLADQLFNSSEKRLARLLLLLANFNTGADLRLISPKISQDVLAARVGTTRSRINFFMNKFRKLGLIEYNGEIKVTPALMDFILRD
jgi:CRP-like cAMP-binding protein